MEEQHGGEGGMDCVDERVRDGHRRSGRMFGDIRGDPTTVGECRIGKRTRGARGIEERVGGGGSTVIVGAAEAAEGVAEGEAVGWERE